MEAILFQNDSNCKLKDLTYDILHYTIIFLLTILLIFPAWKENSNNQFFLQSISILLIGWMDLITGVISWYWFIGLHFLFKKIRNGTLFKKEGYSHIFLITFFSFCLFSMTKSIHIGNISPFAIDAGWNKIISLETGYYAYILMMLYLISLTIITRLNIKFLFKEKLIKIISIITIFLGILSTYFSKNLFLENPFIYIACIYMFIFSLPAFLTYKLHSFNKISK